MFQKYQMLLVAQVFLFVYIAPLVVGIGAGFFGKEKIQKKIWWIAGGLIGLIELAVLIDRHGEPFLMGHLVDMFSSSPLEANQQFLAGLIGDGALLLLFRYFIGKGIAMGLRLSARSTAK